MGQLSFFSAEALPPRLDDLDGLLAGPGTLQVTPSGARLSVVVTDGWRSAAMADALDALELPAELRAEPVGGTLVGTPPLRALLPLAQRWGADPRNAGGSAVKVPPPDLVLDGRRLRWWCLAAGAADPQGYVLPLGPHDGDAWAAIGAALAGAGLAGVFLPPGARGPAYKVVGAKRLRRLAELVGAAPADAPAGAWPTP